MSQQTEVIHQNGDVIEGPLNKLKRRRIPRARRREDLVLVIDLDASG
ncbi:hypothetical protein [Phenylobacterium sp.]|jgi:hypothetical protein